MKLASMRYAVTHIDCIAIYQEKVKHAVGSEKMVTSGNTFLWTNVFHSMLKSYSKSKLSSRLFISSSLKHSR